jgi:hypothetical protein
VVKVEKEEILLKELELEEVVDLKRIIITLMVILEVMAKEPLVVAVVVVLDAPVTVQKDVPEEMV